MYDYYRETLRTKTKQKKKSRLNLIYLFACLFVWGLSSHWKKFHSYGNVHTSEELQI